MPRRSCCPDVAPGVVDVNAAGAEISQPRPFSAATMQCVLDTSRSGSGSTQSLPAERPIDKLPVVNVWLVASPVVPPPVRLRCRVMTPMAACARGFLDSRKGDCLNDQ